MTRQNLSSKQEEILAYIKRTILDCGYPPTVREICDAVHLNSPSSVHAHLTTLEKLGYIRKNPAQPRTIEIVDDNFYQTRHEMVQIPVVGRVAAGEPILAVENIESYYPIPADELGRHSGDLFILEVHGDSMIDIGIYDRDRIVVEETKTASNGEVAVVLVDDSATLKRFYKEDGHFRLQPENETMAPIIVENCEVIGKPIMLIRSLR